MLLKNTSGQGVYLYAIVLATGAVDTGDAANITGHYTLDGTDHTGFGTANPTEIGAGVYWQPLAQAETNANAAAFRWASATGGVQIGPVFCMTTGVSIPVVAPGAANGTFIAGTNAATVITTSLTTHFVGTVDTVTTYTGNTVQTGDSFARLGAPSGASIDADILTRLATSGYTVPPTAAAIGAVVAAGAVASVTGSVGSVTGAVGSVTGSVGSVTGAVGSVTGAVGSVAGAVGSVTGAVGSVTAAVTISLATTLSAARALDAISDTSLTLNDAFHCAIAGACGKESVSGTTYLIETPHTGTTLRTFTLDSGSAPTQRS